MKSMTYWTNQVYKKKLSRQTDILHHVLMMFIVSQVDVWASMQNVNSGFTAIVPENSQPSHDREPVASWRETWALFQYNCSPSRYQDFQNKDKMVMRPAYLFNGLLVRCCFYTEITPRALNSLQPNNFHPPLMFYNFFVICKMLVIWGTKICYIDGQMPENKCLF